MQFVLKDLLIDTEARTVCRGNQLLELPDLSFDVLVKLIERAPSPIDVETLSDTVWRNVHVSDETIAQRIALLRKVLGDSPKAPVYVRTVRGAGYCVAGKVRRDDGASIKRSISKIFEGRRAASGLIACGVLVAAWLGLEPRVFEPDEQLTTIASADDQATLLVQRAREQLRLHQAEETDRAIVMLRDALERAPDRAEARLALSVALSTKATKFRGESREEAEAEALARGLTREIPSNSNAWSALGYSLSSQGRTHEALAAYRQALDLDPKNVSALSSAAYLLLSKGDLQQALVLEVRAKNHGGASRYAEIQIAQVLELIDHPAALKWQDRALTMNPQQAVVLSEIARSKLRRGNPKAALQTLAQYEGRDGSAPLLLVLEARALLALGHSDDARDLLSRAGWRGHFDLAAIFALEGYTQYAESTFSLEKRADLASDPDPRLRIQLAEVSAALGDENEAIDLVSQAVSLGWRDVLWLQQSPFLQDLMATERGRQIERRIAREVAAQRRLIEATEEFDLLLKG
ncbi:MAG: tetratricopeptide repeat protein [Henriciella sp.]